VSENEGAVLHWGREAITKRGGGGGGEGVGALE